ASPPHRLIWDGIGVEVIIGHECPRYTQLHVTRTTNPFEGAERDVRRLTGRIGALRHGADDDVSAVDEFRYSLHTIDITRRFAELLNRADIRARNGESGQNPSQRSKH